jgi:hypothetical protein
MLAALMTIAFAATAILAIAVITASLAKGFAAAAALRRQIALCPDERVVTVRHGRALAHPFAEHGFSPVRAPRRKLRASAHLPTGQRRLVAA